MSRTRLLEIFRNNKNCTETEVMCLLQRHKTAVIGLLRHNAPYEVLCLSIQRYLFQASAQYRVITGNKKWQVLAWYLLRLENLQLLWDFVPVSNILHLPRGYDKCWLYHQKVCHMRPPETGRTSACSQKLGQQATEQSSINVFGFYSFTKPKFLVWQWFANLALFWKERRIKFELLRRECPLSLVHARIVSRWEDSTWNHVAILPRVKLT